MYDQGLTTYKQALNGLSDRTSAELAMLTGIKIDAHGTRRVAALPFRTTTTPKVDKGTKITTTTTRKATTTTSKRPTTTTTQSAASKPFVDWRTVSGVVQPVKDQGNCG